MCRIIYYSLSERLKPLVPIQFTRPIFLIFHMRRLTFIIFIPWLPIICFMVCMRSAYKYWLIFPTILIVIIWHVTYSIPVPPDDCWYTFLFSSLFQYSTRIAANFPTFLCNVNFGLRGSRTPQFRNPNLLKGSTWLFNVMVCNISCGGALGCFHLSLLPYTWHLLLW